MNAPSQALQNGLIPRLFSRFRAIYGNKVDVAYGKADPGELIAVWSEELGDCDGADIVAAVAELRVSFIEFPPTLYQFSDLCKAAKRRRQEKHARIDHQPPREPIPANIKEQLHRFIRKANLRA